MVISDRISAFDCIFHGEGGLKGIPGKGAALNAISTIGLNCSPKTASRQPYFGYPAPVRMDSPKARPIKVEAICRQYITGSMWRAYSRASEYSVASHRQKA